MIPGLALAMGSWPHPNDEPTRRERPRVAGIDGSARRGNTHLLLTEALSEASEAGADVGVIELRKEKIRYCIGCGRCHRESPSVAGCRTHRDAMDLLIPRLLECDAIILATPVYFAGPTAQLKTFMDRTEPLLRYGCEPLRSALRNKIGAGLVVGGNRNGGQESTLQALLHFFLIHDMLVVGAGPDPSPGCYLGAAGFSGPGEGADAKSGVADDEVGLRGARILGRRVVEAAALIKTSVSEQQPSGDIA